MPWQPKSDAPHIVVLDSGAVSLLLAAWPQLVYLAPALAGRVIDTASFCAAGPAYTPPVTMADIVWFGVPPDDGRPHTLLTVTRAIADAEAFAKYCENASGGGWVLIEAQTQGWNAEWGPDWVWYHKPIPAGTTKLAIWHAADTGFTPSGDPSVAGGGGTIAVNTAAGPDARSFQVCQDWVGYGYTVFNLHAGSGTAGSAWELWGLMPTSTSGYTPPVGGTDPNVSLPDGTGATLDQLEVKLDQIQLALHAAAAPGFALDPLSVSGSNALVADELGDAVGVLITVTGRPAGRTEWGDDPPRFPRMAVLTFGNGDGWFPSIEIDHETTVFLPLPLGATKYTVKCEPPMVASVTQYRRTAGP